MKSTGIVRNMDFLGRISVPKEVRRVFAINNGDPLEFLSEEKDGTAVIVLRKYEQGCIFCSSLEDTIEYHGKKICKGCIKETSSRFK